MHVFVCDGLNKMQERLNQTPATDACLFVSMSSSIAEEGEGQTGKLQLRRFLKGCASVRSTEAPNRCQPSKKHTPFELSMQAFGRQKLLITPVIDPGDLRGCEPRQDAYVQGNT